ncbi:MAG: restriction endonuclease subunit S [Nitrososphaeraceae archaeon]
MKVKIKDVFDVKTGVRITEEEVYSHFGSLPCITAQTKDNGIAWHADEEWLGKLKTNGEKVLIDEPCITWSKDGVKAGTMFYRDYKFFPIDVCGVLIPKPEFIDYINLKWFMYTYQEYIYSQRTSDSSQPKLYNEQMSVIEFDLPTLKDGTIDVNTQNQIVMEYEKLISIKNKLHMMFKKLKSKSEFELDIQKYDLKTVDEIALLNKGSNRISEEAIYRNFDSIGYPVYSSATENEGLMGRVKKEYFDNFHKKGNAGELTWTTNGYAGMVFYRDTNYLYSEKCGRIVLRREYQDLINPKYLMLYLNQVTYKYKTAESNNGKLDIIHMSNIPVKLPVDDEGNISIAIQDSIVETYSKLWMFESKLIDINQRINNYLN